MTETEENQLDDIVKRAKSKYKDKGDRESHVVELLAPYLKVRSTHAYAWYMYGDCLRILGRNNEALQALKKALELTQPKDKGLIRLRIGMLFSDSGSLAEAEQWYGQAMEDEECPVGWTWIYRGTNFSKIGEFEKALECFQVSLQKEDVDREESYLNIGYVFRAMGKYAEAIEAFQNALEIDPNYREAQTALEGLQGIQETQELAAQIKT